MTRKRDHETCLLYRQDEGKGDQIKMKGTQIKMKGAQIKMKGTQIKMKPPRSR